MSHRREAGEVVSVWSHHIVPDGTVGRILQLLSSTTSSPGEDYQPEYTVVFELDQPRPGPKGWVEQQSERRGRPTVTWPLSEEFIFDQEHGLKTGDGVVLQLLPGGGGVSGLAVGVEGTNVVQLTSDPALLALKKMADAVTLAMYIYGSASVSADVAIVLEMLGDFDRLKDETEAALLARVVGPGESG